MRATFLAHLILLDHFKYSTRRTIYETPRHAVFSSLLFFTFLSSRYSPPSSYSQTLSVYEKKQMMKNKGRIIKRYGRQRK
jgi:hypothetical protein